MRETRMLHASFLTRHVFPADADFARAAAAAPFAVNLTTGFFSDRIGCQIHQPLYGISLGALCLRP